jgi:hypothetical protein
MTALVLNRRHLLTAGGAVLATGVSGLLLPARAQGLAPTAARTNVACRAYAVGDCHRRRERDPRRPDRGNDGDDLEGGALRAGPRGDRKNHD